MTPWSLIHIIQSFLHRNSYAHGIVEWMCFVCMSVKPTFSHMFTQEVVKTLCICDHDTHTYMHTLHAMTHPGKNGWMQRGKLSKNFLNPHRNVLWSRCTSGTPRGVSASWWDLKKQKNSIKKKKGLKITTITTNTYMETTVGSNFFQSEFREFLTTCIKFYCKMNKTNHYN